MNGLICPLGAQDLYRWMGVLQPGFQKAKEYSSLQEFHFSFCPAVPGGLYFAKKPYASNPTAFLSWEIQKYKI